MVKSTSADVQICGRCVRIRAGISVRVSIRVNYGIRISNSVGRSVKVVGYSLVTALHIATSADPLMRFLRVTKDGPILTYVVSCFVLRYTFRQYISV